MLVPRFQVRCTRSRTLVLLALCLMLIGSGCAKKPVRAVPAVLAPSIETEPQPIPQPQQPPDDNASAPQPAPASEPAANKQKPKPKPRRPAPRKPVQAPQQPAAVEAPKQETPRPTPTDNSAQITADVPRAAVQSQRQNTENLLRSSEGKLSHITRAMGDSEQGMMRQARNYIAQSNQALQAGDIERAYNLAVKASLLASELAK